MERLMRINFLRFIDCLQNEILEVEFVLSSPNGATVSPTGFARDMMKFCRAECKQAIGVCANVEIGEEALQTLFCMFDSDGDGHMRAQEFIVLPRIMRARRIHKARDLEGLRKVLESCNA
ncbi:hypothetical protein TSMEX_003470 [Taenia solium]|eukprot:TsM_000367900 transcript=TsM_000367900 gene=TsM_000367900